MQHSLCWNEHTLSISSWYPPKFRCASLSSPTDSVIQTSSPILTRVVDAILGISWIILESVTITMILLQAIRSNRIINHSSSVSLIGFACRFVATRLSPEKKLFRLHYRFFRAIYRYHKRTLLGFKQHLVYSSI